MRWMTAGLLALLLVGVLGCPHAFGREGTIDKAIHKDVMERLQNGRCTPDELDLYCSEGKNLEDCLEKCG